MDHYYDGCLGYWQSAARRNSFNFSLPFTTDVKASLHFKAGDKIENPTQVTGKKIGMPFRFCSRFPSCPYMFHSISATAYIPANIE